MNKNGYIIRQENENDYRAVENLVHEAFWNVYRPGCFEHYLIHVMRDDPVFIHEFDFLLEAEVDGFDKRFPPKEQLKLPTQLFG